MLRFDGKVALVTGCGSSGTGWGNGKAIAALLARQGARVMGLDRNAAAAEETRCVVQAEGGEIATRVCDVTHAEQIGEAVQECVRRFGRIDVLINNVGMSRPGGIVDMDVAVWDEQFDVNLKSVFMMCKAVLPIMDGQGDGSIVNISSISALRYSGKNQIAYSTSKAGLIQFTRMAALMHGKNGVRMNCVVPGLITTPLVHRLAQQFGDGDYEGYLARRNAQVPLARSGDAWDVAHATLFLASDEARYITGTELLVDGGVSSTMR